MVNVKPHDKAAVCCSIRLWVIRVVLVSNAFPVKLKDSCGENGEGIEGLVALFIMQGLSPVDWENSEYAQYAGADK